MTKMSFLDSTLAPLPPGCTFEVLAYATEEGVSDEAGLETWLEDRVAPPTHGASGDGGGSFAGGAVSGSRAMEIESPSLIPVKSTKTSIVSLDAFVETRHGRAFA